MSWWLKDQFLKLAFSSGWIYAGPALPCSRVECPASGGAMGVGTVVWIEQNGDPSMDWENYLGSAYGNKMYWACTALINMHSSAGYFSIYVSKRTVSICRMWYQTSLEWTSTQVTGPLSSPPPCAPHLLRSISQTPKEYLGGTWAAGGERKGIEREVIPLMDVYSTCRET